MIESNHLQALITVIETGSLSNAAKSLNVTQSAISQSIKVLENKVGFKILERHGKNTVLTPDAVKLGRLAKTYFKRFDDFLVEIQNEKKSIAGELKVGTLIGIGKSWVATQMMEFSREYPQLSISVTLEFPEKLLKMFQDHQLDCIIIPKNMAPQFAESLDMHDEYSTLVFPDHPDFKISTDSSLKDILQYPLIFFEDHDPLFHRWCHEKFNTTPRNLKPRLTVNSFGNILHAVNEGLGIAVIPTHVFKRSYFKDKVKTLGKKFDIKNDKFSFTFHTENRESLKIQTLYEFLKEKQN
jgi:DNA-binding transcriptional LysR family regulator